MTNDLGLHFKASSYCTLCRESLPEPQYDLDFEPPPGEVWEYKVLAICDISFTNTSFGIIALVADLTKPDTFSELSFITISRCRVLNIYVCLSSECGKCKADKIAYLAHIDCWKLISKQKNRPKITSIYKLAQSTYPLFGNGHVRGGLDRITTNFTNIPDDNNSDRTDIGRFLGSLSRLPLEIQLAISARCRRNLLSSLLKALRTSSILAGFNSHIGSILDLTWNAAVDNISARLLNVYGRSYISLLGCNVTMKHGFSIPVKRSGTRGLKFVIDVYGIRAISILYSDGSTSPWLGDAKGGWKGIIYGENVVGLCGIRDDLKYLRIDLIESKKSVTIPKDLVMWDTDIHFPSTISYQILEAANRRPQIRNFPGWRLCRYLPLINDGSYITGLTMYCDGHSVTGVIAHGESSRLIGYRQGCPIHLYLQKSERIISVWIRTPYDSIPTNWEVEPTILVMTSHRRTCIFGPYVPRDSSQLRHYAWTNLSKYPGSEVSGIFYDALLVSSRNQITTIGITQVIKPDNGLIVEDIPSIPIPNRMPSMPGTVSMNSFISIGTFSGVQRLKVYKLGTRCAGISIWHDNDTIEVLGQWDPTQPSTVSEIYNCYEGPLTGISFCFSTSKPYIEDISARIGNAEPVENEHSRAFHVNQLSQPIAWWFTRSYDHVEVWNGTFEDVVVSARKFRVMDLG